MFALRHAQRFLAAGLLAVGTLLAPVCGHAMIIRAHAAPVPVFEGAKIVPDADFLPVAESSQPPEEEAFTIGHTGWRNGIICNNDPVNSVDPLGLAATEYNVVSLNIPGANSIYYMSAGDFRNPLASSELGLNEAQVGLRVTGLGLGAMALAGGGAAVVCVAPAAVGAAGSASAAFGATAQVALETQFAMWMARAGLVALTTEGVRNPEFARQVIMTDGGAAFGEAAAGVKTLARRSGSIIKSAAAKSTPRPHRVLVDDFKTSPQNWERTGTQAGPTPEGQHKGGLNIESQWRNKVTGEELSVHEAWRPDGRSIHPENASPNIPDGGSIRPRNRAKELQ